nr:hypothetical protein [Tanacetum cinerariifolium]
MAYTSLSTSSLDSDVSSCYKACVKSYETLKEHYDNLTKDFNKSQLNLGAYKAGLESVEARLEVYKKNEVNDKYKTCEGYHAVPPPYTRNFMAPKPDLVFSDEHVVSESVTGLPVSNGLGPQEKLKFSYLYVHDNPQQELQEKGVIDSRCSRHMSGNMTYLSKYKEIDGGCVAFGRDPKGGKITSKDTECVVLSPNFKLLDESQVLLRVPRKNNMYSVDLKIVAPLRGLTCLFAKATLDESNLWHMRLGHINFKTIKKLVRENLVRGLPSRKIKMIIHVLLVRKESNIKPLVRAKL